MSAIDLLFSRLRAAGKKAFIPFLTAGDPDLALTGDLVRELAARGASLVELGIPYSDPIADGPVIQASYTRALGRKIKLGQILESVRSITPTVQTPLVTMLSYAIIYRHGIEKYIRDAQAAGIAGAIVPDLPLDESEALAKLCRQADFSLIQLVTPTTPRERALRIAETSSGFLYYVSITGITGERTELPPELIENVNWLRKQTPIPVCIGFGISRPEHVRLLKDAADGVIVGSAIVRRLADPAGKTPAELVRDVGEFAGSLIAALD